MKKLLLGLLLIVSFNCIGQKYGKTSPKYGKTVFDNDSTKNYFFYGDSLYIKPLKLQEFKMHIDSAYLQRIIEALEERGYTLVKLPKKQ